MIDFCIFTLGCKTNQTESRLISKELIDNGYSVSLSLIKANNYIINTCSVTHEANSKSHQTIARVLKLNADANIFVLGCSSQFDKKAFLDKQSVKLVFGTEDRNIVAQKVVDYTKRNAPKNKIKLIETKNINRTRAMVKIQDGCDRFCSYCIVPFLRGKSKSKPLEEVVLEVKNLSSDVKEYSITGICISDYKVGVKSGLVQLITALEKSHPARFRLGSLHPDTITKNFLEALKKTNFCPHFHLSVQSGSDSVLKRMNRRYTGKMVLEKIKLIREFFPNSSITADIIAGFGNETLDEFKETLFFLEQAKLSGLHVFAYSEREGTKAAKLPQLANKVRIVRAAELKKIAEIYRNNFIRTQLNIPHQVLMHKDSEGYTSNYIKVYSNYKKNELITITPTKLYKDGLI